MRKVFNESKKNTLWLMGFILLFISFSVSVANSTTTNYPSCNLIENTLNTTGDFKTKQDGINAMQDLINQQQQNLNALEDQYKNDPTSVSQDTIKTYKNELKRYNATLDCLNKVDEKTWSEKHDNESSSGGHSQDDSGHSSDSGGGSDTPNPPKPNPPYNPSGGGEHNMNFDDLSQNHGFVYDVIKLIFGNFIGQYGGGSDNAAQMYNIITHLGWWACWAAMILAGIIVLIKAFNFYRVAEDPSMQGKSQITMFLMLGVVIMILFPASPSGSLMQNIGAVKVPLMGDAFANMVYKSTVTEMLKPPQLANTDVNASKIANQIFTAEVCAFGVQAHSEDLNPQLKDVYKDDKEIVPVESSLDIAYGLSNTNQILYKTTQMKLNVSDYSKLSKVMFSPKVSTNFIGQGFTQATSDVCGTLIFPEEKSGTTVFDQVSQQQSDELKKSIVNLVNNLAPAAQLMQVVSQNNINMETNNKDDVQRAIAEIRDRYFQAVKTYISEVKYIPQSINVNVLNNSDMKQFIDDSGWGLAVLWWKLLADTQSSFIQNANAFNNSMSAKTIPVCADKSSFALLNYFFGDKYCVPKDYYDTMARNLKVMSDNINAQLAVESSASGGLKQDASAEFSSICSASGCSFESVDGWLGGMLRWVLKRSTDSQLYSQGIGDKQLKDIVNFNNQQSIFDVASKLGSSLSAWSTTLFGLGFSAEMGASVLDGASKTVAGFFGGALATQWLSGTLHLISNFLLNGAYMLWALACSLLVMLPFMPLIIWGVLLLSYFIMLIEAYIAIPLSTALWVVEDQTFISGRLIRTIMMISALFLRPFLFVVGLVAAFVLSPIALMIWNIMFFWGSTLLTTSTFLTSLFLIGIYTAGLLKFTMITYNVAFIIPDKILQWMGSGFGDVSAFGSPADFSSMSGGSGGGGSGGGGGATSIASQGANRIAKAWSDKKEEQKKESEKGGSPYGGGGNVKVNGQSQNNLTSAAVLSSNAKSPDSYNF
ncbi:MAG: DotA/TraY family protein [Proteobacteria bacterium]|nr:DotA/TraY family protein [Pseudomonadota bacterium]